MYKKFFNQMFNGAVFIILLIVNLILYGLCCFLILRRKSFTCISIRSPRLLILNNIGNFFIKSMNNRDYNNSYNKAKRGNNYRGRRGNKGNYNRNDN